MSLTDARAVILERIRAAGASSSAPAEVTPPPPDTVLDESAMLELLVENLRDYRAVVTEVNGAELRPAVDAVLQRHDCRTVTVAPALDDSDRPTDAFTVIEDHGLSSQELDGIDAVVTTSRVAIAETGTVVLDHDGGQARRALSLVPDVHICIVRADQVVTSVPEGVSRLRSSVEKGLPLTWISGPSATSDIELNRVEGVHGPRNLEVILVR